MARFKTAGKTLLHTLWRRPFVEPTTGGAMVGLKGRQGREFPLDGSVEVTKGGNAPEDTMIGSLDASTAHSCCWTGAYLRKERLRGSRSWTDPAAVRDRVPWSP